MFSIKIHSRVVHLFSVYKIGVYRHVSFHFFPFLFSFFIFNLLLFQKNKNRRISQIVDTISLNLLEIVRDYTMAADFVTYRRRRRYYRGLYQQNHLVSVNDDPFNIIVAPFVLFFFQKLVKCCFTFYIEDYRSN